MKKLKRIFLAVFLGLSDACLPTLLNAVDPHTQKVVWLRMFVSLSSWIMLVMFVLGIISFEDFFRILRFIVSNGSQ